LGIPVPTGTTGPIDLPDLPLGCEQADLAAPSTRLSTSCVDLAGTLDGAPQRAMGEAGVQTLASVRGRLQHDVHNCRKLPALLGADTAR
jgi:hypothetical protein